MARTYLSVGSNVDSQKNILSSIAELKENFGALTCSKVYESKAVGFDGDNFLNLVVGFDTELSVGELSGLLKRIEVSHGRKKGQVKFSARTLDLDILTYDDLCGEFDGVELPRGEILSYAFVLLPLVDVAADELHVSTRQSYAALWEQFSGDKQGLWPIDISLPA
ncbi:MAG: 2-amino-4-hydroxy-6-hydroxymethyldihydropteridine diphosphokinase [Moraxellaceae bacterium]|nr:MAG: 2-amino-4-hydroxy-6-hydroxymethyldihydropteridine diphosphokinase [Moraxellaceae bacterium]